MNLKMKRAMKGFTLIELLVVVLILAILMAIALPLYLKSVKDSQEKTCQANMQAIAHAVQANFVRAKGSAYFGGKVSTENCATDAALEDLQTAPRCPADNTGADYTVVANGTNGFTVSCPAAATTKHPDLTVGAATASGG